ncbi:methyltransferase [Williamsia sp. CHRR-6]|uniref:methyltransferase n=1 Tax=Williamsia sp. CHRR-6 TaxID=2835871 RepID=UPI001BDA161B|nr:methyltransferase [Williamsia sp. CHRR-6]MBT0565847.1 methyltransferase [Williamsia sp. CHRR-6]
MPLSPGEIDEFLTEGRALDAIALDVMTLALARRVSPDAPTFPLTVDALLDGLGCATIHRPLLRRWVSTLAAAGRITLEDNVIVSITNVRASTVERAWRGVDTTRAYPGYLRRALAQVPDLLTGELSPHTLMFGGPESAGGLDLSIAYAIYRDNPSSRMVNEAAGEWVAGHLNSLQRRGRIVELGAGTGATTESVVLATQHISPAPHYLFTDVSEEFLRHAHARFGDLVATAIVDIARPLGPQVHATGGAVDVVVAANVAHNANDINAFCAEVRAVLADDGLLVLIETSVERPQLLASAEFLMSGNEASHRPPTDARRTSGAMLPAVSEWTSALLCAGFTTIERLPHDDHPLAETGQFGYAARVGSAR